MCSNMQKVSLKNTLYHDYNELFFGHTELGKKTKLFCILRYFSYKEFTGHGVKGTVSLNYFCFSFLYFLETFVNPLSFFQACS